MGNEQTAPDVQHTDATVAAQVDAQMAVTQAVDGRRVALEAVSLGLVAVGVNAALRDGLDDEKFELAMQRAARIRRWVLAVGDAD